MCHQCVVKSLMNIDCLGGLIGIEYLPLMKHPPFPQLFCFLGLLFIYASHLHKKRYIVLLYMQVFNNKAHQIPIYLKKYISFCTVLIFFHKCLFYFSVHCELLNAGKNAKESSGNRFKKEATMAVFKIT